jgi:hypothetical protein
VSYDIFLSIYDVFLLTILSFWKFQKGNFHFDLFLIYVGLLIPYLFKKIHLLFTFLPQQVSFLFVVELVFLFVLGLLIPISLANFLIYVGTYKLVLHLLLLGLF